MSQPLQISAETAQMLSKQLGVPIEHLMHMPKHILIEKLTALTKQQAQEAASSEDKANDERPKE